MEQGGFMIFFFLIVALIAYLIGKWGETREIGFGWAFALSFLLSPFIGIIAVLCSKKKDIEFSDRDKN